MPLAITSITPNKGITPGWDRVTILGTDFDIHPFPPAPGFVGTPEPWPPVKVTFGGQEAQDEVWVYATPGGNPGDTTIECNTPRFVGSRQALPAAVDVVVTNLINPGSVTSAGGFTYELPDALAVQAIALLSKALVQELERQMPVNVVSLGTHTDYDASTGDALNLVEVASLPALLVRGPRLDRSAAPYQRRTQTQEVADPDFRRKRGSLYFDMAFDLELLDENKDRAMSLSSWLATWVRDNNGSLRVEKVTGDPDQGFHAFDLDMEQAPQVSPRPGKDNISVATAQIVVRGVPVDRNGGIEQYRAPTMENEPSVGLSTL